MWEGSRDEANLCSWGEVSVYIINLLFETCFKKKNFLFSIKHIFSLQIVMETAIGNLFPICETKYCSTLTFPPFPFLIHVGVMLYFY